MSQKQEARSVKQTVVKNEEGKRLVLEEGGDPVDFTTPVRVDAAQEDNESGSLTVTPTTVRRSANEEEEEEEEGVMDDNESSGEQVPRAVSTSRQREEDREPSKLKRVKQVSGATANPTSDPQVLYRAMSEIIASNQANEALKRDVDALNETEQVLRRQLMLDLGVRDLDVKDELQKLKQSKQFDADIKRLVQDPELAQKTIKVLFQEWNAAAKLITKLRKGVDMAGAISSKQESVSRRVTRLKQNVASIKSDLMAVVDQKREDLTPGVLEELELQRKELTRLFGLINKLGSESRGMGDGLDALMTTATNDLSEVSQKLDASREALDSLRARLDGDEDVIMIDKSFDFLSEQFRLLEVRGEREAIDRVEGGLTGLGLLDGIRKLMSRETQSFISGLDNRYMPLVRVHEQNAMRILDSLAVYGKQLTLQVSQAQRDIRKIPGFFHEDALVGTSAPCPNLTRELFQGADGLRVSPDIVCSKCSDLHREIERVHGVSSELIKIVACQKHMKELRLMKDVRPVSVFTRYDVLGEVNSAGVIFNKL